MTPAIILAVGILFAVAVALFLWVRANHAKTKRLIGVYSYADIRRALSGYVEPDFQSVDPAGQEDFRHVLSVRENAYSAMDRMLDSPNDQKFFILLADSGMGKTSFCLNYAARHYRSRSRRKRYDITVVPLGVPDSEQLISSIPLNQRRRTVLFMDGFDEDALAIRDYRSRLARLVEASLDFLALVLTARTQFFASDEEVPAQTGVLRLKPVLPNEPRSYQFRKIYLAPFNDVQIRSYVRQHTRFWHVAERLRTSRVLEQIADLAARPMLLAFVQDIVRTGGDVPNELELYDRAVQAWIERESAFVPEVSMLAKLLAPLAYELVCNRSERVGYWITADELTVFASRHDVQLASWQLTGRSLLKRDAAGRYTFVHRSIMEYLFVKHCLAHGARQCREPWSAFMKTIAVQMIHAGRTADDILVLDGADLSGVKLHDCSLSGLSLERINLDKAVLVRVNARGCSIAWSNLREASLRDVDLRGSDLSDCDLGDAHLAGVNLSNAVVRNSRLTGSVLRGVLFREADLRDVSFDQADLRSALDKTLRIPGEALEVPEVVDFTEAGGLTESQLGSARGDVGVVLPRGLSVPTSWLGTRELSSGKSTRRSSAPTFERVLASAIEASEVSELTQLSEIAAALPSGNEALGEDLARVRLTLERISNFQYRLNALDRPVMRELAAENVLEQILTFRLWSGSLEPPLNEFRLAATKWSKIAERQLEETRSILTHRATVQVFRAGVPINRDSEAFVLRDSLVGELERRITSTNGCPGLVLYGRRRMGKSTLLRNLPGSLPREVVPLVISMQDATAFGSLSLFLDHLSREIGPITGAALPIVDLPGLQTALHSSNERLQAVGHRILLAFDEYEQFDTKIRDGTFSEDLLAVVRDSIQTDRNLIWLFAGSHEITELKAAEWTSFLVSAVTIEVPPFSFEETRLLLTDPLRYSDRWKSCSSRPSFTPEFWGEGGLERIHAEADGWPHLVQLIAESTIDVLNAVGATEVTPDLFRQALDKAIVSGQIVLSQLMRAECVLPGEWEYLEGFRNGDQQRPPTDEAIRASLRRRKLVVDEDSAFRLRVPLMRRWLQQRA